MIFKPVTSGFSPHNVIDVTRILKENHHFMLYSSLSCQKSKSPVLTTFSMSTRLIRVRIDLLKCLTPKVSDKTFLTVVLLTISDPISMWILTVFIKDYLNNCCNTTSFIIVGNYCIVSDVC